MAAPAKAGKFTFYRPASQGFTAERLGTFAQPDTKPVARELAPGGLRSGPKPANRNRLTHLNPKFTTAAQPDGNKLPRHKSRATLRRRSRPQPPSEHIQHITAIAQRNGAEQGKVAEDERLTLD